jgi:hypothetical protein
VLDDFSQARLTRRVKYSFSKVATRRRTLPVPSPAVAVDVGPEYGSPFLSQHRHGIYRSSLAGIDSTIGVRTIIGTL